MLVLFANCRAGRGRWRVRRTRPLPDLPGRRRSRPEHAPPRDQPDASPWPWSACLLDVGVFV